MANAMPSLELLCLGSPSVRVDRHEPPPDVLWRKHTALLVYLALSPNGTRARSHLLGLLWAESPEDKARRSLNEAVRLLRAALGTERLLTHGDALQLNAAGLEVDALRFESLRGAGQLGALDLIRGDFLVGERPSVALSALVDRIRAGKWQRPRGRHDSIEPPLVGRRESHAQIFARLERLSSGGPCCLVITGDAGSGRTRLLDASAARLALAGATVAAARILDSDHDAPWSTLRALMRGGLLEAPGITATDHVGLRVLAAIVPELAGRVEPLAPGDVAQVADALDSLLQAVTEQQPVGLFIDDAQWSDGATLAALRAVWSRERTAALALVLTLEQGADLSTELRALVGSVGREIRGAVVRLEPLTQDDIAALTEAMAPWCAGKEERERLARRVAQESGGNPFLAVTLLHDLGQTTSLRQGLAEWPPAGGTLDSSLPITVSEVVRSAVAARVARLDEDSTAVLRAASIAGDVLDPLLLTEVSGLLGTRVDAALDRLERERFVGFDGERYRFTGRLISAVIESECMQAGGRRRLRERYIAALASRDDIDSQLLRAGLLASERAPEAFEVAVRVAERALALGAQRTASSAIRTAERAAEADPERLAVLEALRRQ